MTCFTPVCWCWGTEGVARVSDDSVGSQWEEVLVKTRDCGSGVLPVRKKTESAQQAQFHLEHIAAPKLFH